MSRQTVTNIKILIMCLAVSMVVISQLSAEPLPGGTLDPTVIPKYANPLVIPPAMPRTDKIKQKMSKNIDYYEIAVRQFKQAILPAPMNPTTVWGYGSVNHPGTFNYPSFTIEAKANKPVRIKWINDLVDQNGNYLPHILPVDQTLHWANPPGGDMHKDHQGMDPAPYVGPVPMVPHVHGAHVGPESDGYPEAWWLPNANNIPAGYAIQGTFYDQFDRTNNQPGTAVFQYPNDQTATTLWYHDHSLGMTRLNVYAGPAGFYLLRGGKGDAVTGVLPGPAPALGDLPGLKYYEIPIAVQDRCFNEDGSLFYPDNRAFFEGLQPDQLDIPFVPEMAKGGMSDISPIWNPEFFGNTMVVNGKAWPVLDVEPRRYRFRLLNGCNSRFIVLKMINNLDMLIDDEGERQEVQLADTALPFWQIGAEGGFLPAPVQLQQILMGPAERADVIVDFTGLPVGTEIYLINDGPDEPFGGFPVEELADKDTTAQVMKFVVTSLVSTDTSTPPAQLVLPPFTPLGPEIRTRMLSLNEMDSQTVLITEDEELEKLISDPINGEPFGPQAALLGTMGMDGTPVPLKWMDPITENPMVGDTEIWEIHNFTMDAHPIHLHQVMFQVVNREDMMTGTVTQPELGETGYKDTVIAYPDQITRVKAKFDLEGLYVWHCHIVEHEDNEMMRPYYVGPMPAAPMLIK